MSAMAFLRGVALVAGLFLASVAGASTEPAPIFSKPLLQDADSEAYRQAFAEAERRNWQRALQFIEGRHDPLPGKVLRWEFYRQYRSLVPFDEIARFIADNPKWPGLGLLQRRAEESMDNGVTDEAILNWFHEREPVTGPGQLRLAEAMMRTGMKQDGVSWLRRTWVDYTFSRQDARDFYRKYRRLLTAEDHVARLDRLLWNGQDSSANGMLSLVPDEQRRLAEARMALMRQAPGVDGKVAAVPAELKQDPGLLYDRARWRRRAGLTDGVRELLVEPPHDSGPRPDKWWTERELAARDALTDGEHELAYQVASAHRQSPGTIGFAEAEWLSGWIALRYLSKPEAALAHFRRLYDNVNYPVSIARAAYWSARASDELGYERESSEWYAIATRYPNTFYGQMAIAATHQGGRFSFPEEPVASATELADFRDLELVRVAQTLGELDEMDRARPFMLELAETLTKDTQQSLLAAMANRFGRPDIAVRAAKKAMQTGHPAYSFGYPTAPDRALRAKDTVEPALINAVARQESEFNASAVSRADARGLMQLLPSTARSVAKEVGLPYNSARLLDPEFNTRLGSAYLASLVEDFQGSYILAVAAYNAGPSRVRQWIRAFGDPASGQVDAIDWIEQIPFGETRNYVQRVLENLQVYRALLSGGGTEIVSLERLQQSDKEARAY